jgi:hypothetical protein
MVAAAVSSYLGVIGTHTYKVAPTSTFPDPRGGSFKNVVGQDGMLYVNSSVKFRDVTDGTSNTAMIGERSVPDGKEYGWIIAAWAPTVRASASPTASSAWKNDSPPRPA